MQVTDLNITVESREFTAGTTVPVTVDVTDDADFRKITLQLTLVELKKNKLELMERRQPRRVVIARVSIPSEGGQVELKVPSNALPTYIGQKIDLKHELVAVGQSTGRDIQVSTSVVVLPCAEHNKQRPRPALSSRPLDIARLVRDPGVSTNLGT